MGENGSLSAMGVAVPPAAGTAAPAEQVLAAGVAQGRHIWHTIDGMRGLAAIAVVTFHYRNMLGPWWFESAHLAVDLFFLISGVVIAAAYDQKLAEGLSTWRFMQARMIRLMPLYLLGLCLGASVILFDILMGQSRWSLAQLMPVLVIGVLMLPNPFPAPRHDLFPLNLPSWSLFWEVTVNLLYALLHRVLTLPRVLMVAGLAGVALALLTIEAGTLDFGYNWTRPEIGFLRVVLSFFAGVALMKLHRMGRLPRLQLPPVLLLLATAALLALPAEWGWIKDMACVTLAFPLVCIVALNSEPRFLAPYVLLGMVSYPVYVIHMVIPFARLSYGMLGEQIGDFGPAGGMVAIMILLALSLVLAWFYDIPVRRWINTRLAR
ncbi:acyltransferase family protein [Altererythrobacter xixiisoli]|uniref:Acyltransferase family protein n=1 Tax=Croceibacterium xixiisoli TaxID=1476466 RepID=A0A6I4TT52_9SPHN|nr:acyltransferase [Croceibacterium xixiisoli]MXO97798.1 acyltransferase family protein [Croceibacterium xixiisoli]